MQIGLIAKRSATINVPIQRVWDALVNPDVIKQYMFGTSVVSDWKEASPIVWKGKWQGRKYEDKGAILKLKPQRMISFSPLSGIPDLPENYHTVTIELSPDNNATVAMLTQDNNPDEEERRYSEQNWGMMLSSLKNLIEN